MRRLSFSETKRTPRYSMRKLNVGMASVLLGVTIFGINFTNHSVKAATNEAVANTNNSNSTSNLVQTNPQQTKNNAQTAATQQDSAKDVAAGTTTTSQTTSNNHSGTTTTSQTTSNNHSGATTVNTDSLTTSAKAVRIPATILMAKSTGTGTDRNAAGTVDKNNINDQLAKENQKLANDNNLTSSDNYSSNIYKGKDGKYYKIVTIYGNDYVYRAADIQANGTAGGQWATTAADTKNNIDISKEDLGNGQTRWTVTFFPNKGLQNVGSKLSGLSSAKFGIALTSDYQIVGKVDMKVISLPNQTFEAYTFKPGSTSATEFPIQNLSTEKDFSFNPKTDVDPNTGLINSETMPAYNNQYLQGPYYFTTATDVGAKNLWQTYFFNNGNETYDNNAYDNSPYLGGNHDFHLNNFIIKNETGDVDGAEKGDKIIYDRLGYRLNSKNGVANSNGIYSSDNFNQAMEFKSQGVTSNSQFSSYVISFTTQHTDSHEVELTTGWKNQQFSGISANIYSYQNKYYNMFSRLYGEQRALNAAGVAKTPKDVISGWGDATKAMDQIKKDYLNNAQINVLRNKILNNITDPDAVNNIIKEGNSLNDAMKNLGNSIGQYDSDNKFADHKVDKTKASDRYQYADSGKKSAYDTATDAVSNIISVENGTVNKNKGTYADQATVEQLTKDENDAWNELNGVKPKDNEVNSPVGGTITIEKGHTLDSTDAANAITNKDSLTNVKSYSWSGTPDTSKPGSISPKVIVKYNDDSADEVTVTVKIKGDADKYNPEGGEITVNRNTKLGPTEAEEAIKNPQSLPNGTTYSWAGKKLPDTSTSGLKDGWVVVTYPDTSHDIVPVQINVKKDAESYTVTPKDKVSVDKGEDVDPASLVTVTDPDGKQVQLPAGSIDWKDGAKPDLTTKGDKTGSVEVTFLDGSKKETDVTIHVKSDAETYDPQAQPWTTTVGKTPKADEVISSTDKNGKKMPSNAQYTWKTEPDTSKTGEASGEVTVSYGDGSQDDVPVTINVKKKLDDKEKYHIYGKDGLKVDKNGTLAPQDAIIVKDADGNETTLPEGSNVEWAKDKEPDLSQAGKDVTGEVTVTYPGPDHSKSDPVTVTVHVNGESDNYKVAPKDDVTVPRGSQVDAETTVVAQTPDGKQTSFPDGTKHEWITKPDTDSTGKRTGVVKTTFPDGSTTTTTVSVNVEPNQSDKITPNVPKTKEPVADTSNLTKDEQAKVQKNVEDANKDENGKSTLPEGTTVTVGSDGTATVTYPDGSKDTIPGSDLVRQSKDADKITPNVPKTKEPVADTSNLTKDEQAKVQKNVEDANKDENGKSTLPEGTTVTVGSDGTATVTYPDGSKDTIPGSDLVRQSKDADKITPNVPKTKEPVADTSNLTKDEQAKVQKNVEDANKDENGKSTLPEGTTVTVGSDGTATVTYPDGSKDTIPGSDLVRQSKDADKITPNVPKTKEPVADTSNLTKDEQAKVQKNVEDANKDENGKSTLPEGTTVTVGSDGTATVTYPDGSKDTIPGSDLVRQSKDADKITPNVPKTKEPVADTSNLTKDEQAKVQKNVEDANKDENGKSTLPEGTTVTVGSDGTATVTYPDGSKDTIPGSDLVRQSKDADKITPNVPKTKEPVADTSNLTKDEQAKVQKNVEDANKDENGKSTLPEGTTVTVGSDGTATVTYPDGSKDTIPGSDLVRQSKDADKITPNVPKTKEPVADTSNLTKDEQAKVQKNVEDANKDENGKSTLPEGTTVTVGSDGTATVTYPDGSQDTIPGDQLVQGQKGDTTDAGNITPTVPGGKVTVKDPSHLTDDEKNQVKNNVDNANKDKFPAGTKVTVGDDGTTTVTYPDGSQDTIPGDQLVQGQKGDTTDAGNITPTVPGGKVTVKDPSHLTDDEKNQVKNNVDNANKDKFPAGTKVTVGDDGTTTVTYPDGSQDTIPGDQLVQGQKGDTTDAGNITPTVPGGKVTVKDPSHLTDDEKNQVKNNVDNANKDKFPAGTKVTVGDDGTTTVTYPDGSKDVIAGTDLVIAAESEDVPGSKHHSHRNGSNSSQEGASTPNGIIANAGNNLGVKGESDNAIGNNKATSLKTLPQTGTKDTSVLGVLGMLLASLGLFGFKKKRDEE